MSCPDCFKGFAHPHGDPTGCEETLYGHNTYIAESTSDFQSTILFITDIFGLGLINNKLIADRIAAATGCRVLMPDIIPGGAASVSVMSNMETMMTPPPSGRWWDVFAQMQRAWSFVKMMAVALPFFLRASPGKAYPAILAYARALKADMPAADARLGVMGFCWGAYGSTKLCTEAAVQGGDKRLVDAQWNAHPSFVGPQMIVDAVKVWNTPYAVAVASKDFMVGEAKALETEAELRKVVGESGQDGGPVYELRIYHGCNHGFAVRAFPDNKIEVSAAEEAIAWAGEWFNKYLV